MNLPMNGPPTIGQQGNENPFKKKKKGPPKPPASLQGLQMAIGAKPPLG
jgi:hypothetical protein